MFVTTVVLSELAWYTCITSKYSLILFLYTQKKEQLLGKEVEKNYRELSASGRSIICRGGTLIEAYD